MNWWQTISKFCIALCKSSVSQFLLVFFIYSLVCKCSWAIFRCVFLFCFVCVANRLTNRELTSRLKNHFLVLFLFHFSSFSTKSFTFRNILSLKKLICFWIISKWKTNISFDSVCYCTMVRKKRTFQQIDLPLLGRAPSEKKNL